MEVIKKTQEKLVKMAEFAHFKFFGDPMSDTMREFLRNLSWSFFGGLVAAGIMFVLQLLAARYLGAIEFGKYNALLSFAGFLSLSLLLGTDVSEVRYLSDKRYIKARKNIFATSLFMISVQILVMAIVLLLGKNLFGKYLHLEKTFVIFGFVWAIIGSYKLLFDGYFRSFILLKKQAFVRIFEALSSVVFFALLFWFVSNFRYYHYALVLILGGASFVFVSFLIAFENIGRPNWKSFRLLFDYNKFVIIASLGGLLMTSEKLLISKFIGLRELGIYSAYYMASFLILSNLGGIFMNVFLPSVIKEKENLHSIVKKIDNLFKKTVVFWIFGNGLLIALIILFVGSEYPLEPIFLFLFPLVAYLAFFFTTFLSLLNIDYIKKGSLISLLTNFLIIVTIPMVGNIKIYLIIQAAIYLFFYSFIKKQLLSI